MTDSANTSPLVSAIIPSRNRHAYLARAIASAVAQDYRPIEIIVIDDASDPPVQPSSFDTGDVALRIIRNDKAGGVSKARNAGIQASHGEYVAFLDDDDQWLQHKISRQIAAIAASGGRTRACGCQIIAVDEDEVETGRPDRPENRDGIIESITFFDDNITPSTLVIARSLLDELHGFREDMPAGEDRELLLRLLLREDLAMLSERLVLFTEHRGERLTRNHEAMFRGEEKYRESVGAHIEALNLDRRRIMGYRHAKLGHQAMLAGHWGKGMAAFLAGLVRYPFDRRIAGGAILCLLGPALYHRITAMRIERLRPKS